jgi:rhodanese-related sulfurtransferase
MHFKTTVILIEVLFISFYFFSVKGQEEEKYEVKSNQVQHMIAEGDSLVLLDVRSYEEFVSEEGHLPGAILIPIGELKSRVDEIEKYRNAEMIVICSSGIRSGRATRFLREKGFEAYNMQGGMRAWNKLTENAKKDSMDINHEKISE